MIWNQNWDFLDQPTQPRGGEYFQVFSNVSGDKLLEISAKPFPSA